MSAPSICIPRTINNFDTIFVKTTFESIFGLGSIQRVDIVRGDPVYNVISSTESFINDKKSFCRIFIHFNFWPDDPISTAIRQRILDGHAVNIVYDSTRFWKCSASRATTRRCITI